MICKTCNEEIITIRQILLCPNKKCPLKQRLLQLKNEGLIDISDDELEEENDKLHKEEGDGEVDLD